MDDIIKHNTHNQDVIDFLNRYIQTENPSWAVMCNGVWGCGKTFFIKDYIKKQGINESKPKKKFIYISLYGVKTEEEIDKRLFFECHKFLKGKNSELFIHATQGITALLKADDVFKYFKIKDFLHVLEKKNNKVILVFDDIERAEMTINQILGYINVFVEHNQLHCILLADETKIINNEEYLQKKEKIVGDTFSIEPEYDVVIDNFINSISESEIKKTMKEVRPIILEYFQLSTYSNLRVLLKALSDFYDLIKDTNSKYRQHSELMEQAAKIMISMFIEKFMGTISFENFHHLYDDVLTKEKVSENSCLPHIKKYHWVYEQLSMLFHTPVIPYEVIKLYLQKGFIPKEIINDCFQQSEFFRHEKLEFWEELRQYFSVEDDELERLVLKAQEKLKNQSTPLYETLHICGTLLDYAHDNIMTLTENDIEGFVQSYLDTRDLSQLEAEWVEIRFKISEKYHPYMNKVIFTNILEHIKNLLCKNEISKLNKLAQTALIQLTQDPVKFLEYYTPHRKRDIKGKVYAHIDVNEYFKIFLTFKNKNKWDIIQRQYYMIKYEPVYYAENILFWDSLLSVLLNYPKINDVSMSAHINRQYIKYCQDIKKILDSSSNLDLQKYDDWGWR